VKTNVSKCDVKVSHAEFAYNRTRSFAIGHSPFEANYHVNPLTPLDLIPLPVESRVSLEKEERVKEMKKFHQQIRDKLENVNEM